MTGSKQRVRNLFVSKIKDFLPLSSINNTNPSKMLPRTIILVAISLCFATSSFSQNDGLPNKNSIKKNSKTVLINKQRQSVKGANAKNTPIHERDIVSTNRVKATKNPTRSNKRKKRS